MRQGQEGMQPRVLALAKEFHSLEAFPTSQERAHGNNQDIEEVMLLGPCNPWVLSGLKMLDNRRVDRDRHGVCSSIVGVYDEKQSRGSATGVVVSLG
jgi:hypothetical protein